jgi:histidinol-phosphate/aromatic aminotransferase/cobyric acid decarboxylase-like protein
MSLNQVPSPSPLPTCFHGGAFFSGIGEDFSSLQRRHHIINADVLDAWFPPAPAVVAALMEALPWLLRTSPPTDCSGLIRVIAAARGVCALHILPGAGSSDLIFRAFLHWLSPSSKVLILDPTYGEYAHVLEKVIRCQVDRLPLSLETGYCPLAAGLEQAVGKGYDLIVLVNPNSPTGGCVPRERLEAVLRRLPAKTRCWVDETYVEYAGEDQSVEKFAAQSQNVVVCKSMSKVYALSGARVAYLCGPQHHLASLLAITPPWVVGLPSQLAAVRALESPEYYAQRYLETHSLRTGMQQKLADAGIPCHSGIANFLLAFLPADGPTASEVTANCQKQGIYLRDAALMGQSMGNHTLRIAVKSAEENQRIITCVEAVLHSR